MTDTISIENSLGYVFVVVKRECLSSCTTSPACLPPVISGNPRTKTNDVTVKEKYSAMTSPPAGHGWMSLLCTNLKHPVYILNEKLWQSFTWHWRPLLKKVYTSFLHGQEIRTPSRHEFTERATNIKLGRVSLAAVVLVLPLRDIHFSGHLLIL